MTIDYLASWISAEDGARKSLAVAAGLPPTSLDIQAATLAMLKLDDPLDLLDREWTAPELTLLLAPVDFVAFADFEEISLPESILPKGMPRRLDEETIKFHGEKWRIHKYDPDPFPFLPHAHNLFEGIKLDLRNGRCYRKRTLVSTLTPKTLRAFRSRVKRITLPPLDI